MEIMDYLDNLKVKIDERISKVGDSIIEEEVKKDENL